MRVYSTSTPEKTIMQIAEGKDKSKKKLSVFTLTKHTLYARFENYSQVIVCVCVNTPH